MDYYFRKHISVQESVKLIAKDLIIEAISECNSVLLSNHEIVHSVRKKCKRIRALLRIVRPQIGSSYKPGNIFFRDIGRKLSCIRDQHVLSETLDKLRKSATDQNIYLNIDSSMEMIRRTENETNEKELIREFEKEISGSVVRIEKLKVNSDGFDAIKGGLEKTYRRGRIGMRRAFKVQIDENFHEWRKRVKYHYYHLELLIPLWETIVKEYSNQVHALAEILGYLHDLSVLREFINNNTSIFKNDETIKNLYQIIDAEQGKLKILAFSLGKRIYAEKTTSLSERIGNWWGAWQHDETKLQLNSYLDQKKTAG